MRCAAKKSRESLDRACGRGGRTGQGLMRPAGLDSGSSIVAATARMPGW